MPAWTKEEINKRIKKLEDPLPKKSSKSSKPQNAKEQANLVETRYALLLEEGDEFSIPQDKKEQEKSIRNLVEVIKENSKITKLNLNDQEITNDNIKILLEGIKDRNIEIDFGIVFALDEHAKKDEKEAYKKQTFNGFDKSLLGGKGNVTIKIEFSFDEESIEYKYKGAAQQDEVSTDLAEPALLEITQEESFILNPRLYRRDRAARVVEEQSDIIATALQMHDAKQSQEMEAQTNYDQIKSFSDEKSIVRTINRLGPLDIWSVYEFHGSELLQHLEDNKMKNALQTIVDKLEKCQLSESQDKSDITYAISEVKCLISKIEKSLASDAANKDLQNQDLVLRKSDAWFEGGDIKADADDDKKSLPKKVLAKYISPRTGYDQRKKEEDGYNEAVQRNIGIAQKKIAASNEYFANLRRGSINREGLAISGPTVPLGKNRISVADTPSQSKLANGDLNVPSAASLVDGRTSAEEDASVQSKSNNQDSGWSNESRRKLLAANSTNARDFNLPEVPQSSPEPRNPGCFDRFLRLVGIGRGRSGEYEV